MFAELIAPQGLLMEEWIVPSSYYGPLHSLDLLSTVVFASIGALIAYEQRRNGLSALLYAGLTALGGGTIRDILLGQQPVFWIRSPDYLYLALTAGLLTFVLAHHTTLRRKYFWLADGFSLAIFTIVGIQSTLSTLTITPTLLPSGFVRWAIPLLMGLMTGVAGGLVRDVVAAKTPAVLQQPSSAIASLGGGSVYLALTGFQLPAALAILGAIAIVILILTLLDSIIFKLNICTHYLCTSRFPQQ